MLKTLEWIGGLFPLLSKGGWVMWPLAGCSVVSLTIILERAWFLVVRRGRIISDDFVKAISGLLEKGRLEEAVIACRKNDSIMARILLSGLQIHGAPRAIIRETMEDTGRRETRVLDQSLGVLAAMAGVGPLLGLYGTVLGMIQIFEEVGRQHIGDYGAMAGGIFVALYTTAAGLTVAIPSFLGYRAFSGLSDRYTRDMEELAVDLLNLLDFHREAALKNSDTGAGEEQ
jgi:biopolymer transport protein ExbB